MVLQPGSPQPAQLVPARAGVGSRGLGPGRLLVAHPSSPLLRPSRATSDRCPAGWRGLCCLRHGAAGAVSIPDRPAQRRSSRTLGLHRALGHLRPRPPGRPRARLAAAPAGPSRAVRSCGASGRVPCPAPPEGPRPPPRRPSRAPAYSSARPPARRGLGRLAPPPPPPPPPQLGPFKRPRRGGRAAWAPAGGA